MASSIQGTTFSGKVITIPRRTAAARKKTRLEESASDGTAGSEGGKLSAPYHRLVQGFKKEKELALAEAAFDAANTSAEASTSSAIETTLWTDIYRPKKFTDLIGDERDHRTALLWLKEWDQCVFKGGINGGKSAMQKEREKEKRKKRAREGNGNNKPFGEGQPSMGLEEDPYGRPDFKILLLSGPPGLGKTTLAHVLARQAGYQVLEVNASDDRTGSVVEDRIRNALETRSLSTGASSSGMGGASNWKEKEKREIKLGTNRPTCVVIDEIDGAGGGGGEGSFIKSLVRLITEGTTGVKRRGKGKPDRPLLRPIICICNDLYAPSLRPLRPLARIIRFSQPTNLLIVRRLRTICDDQKMTADSKNLTMLVEAAEGDLRSCLNTLQFIRRRSTVVDAEAIKAATIGLKDTSTSATTVIERLFKKPSTKKALSNTATDVDLFLPRIVRDLQTCGEWDKITQGVFENYMGAKSLNEDWNKLNTAGDWLDSFDKLNKHVQSEREYDLYGYLAYSLAPFYKLFATHTANKTIDFPKVDYEAYQKRVAHQEVADAFVLGLPQHLRNLFTGPNVTCELLPLLNRIIRPDLKPVNSQLIKPEEKAVLGRLVSQMTDFKLAFVLDKDENGQLSYKLDPPIDLFIHYDGKRASDVAASRYVVRHMVAKEMEYEVLRRSGGGGTAAGGGMSVQDILGAYKAARPDEVVGPAGGGKEAVDFFGRSLKLSTAESSTFVDGVQQQQPLLLSEEPSSKRRKVVKALYKYHEGFSNAVRVTKRIEDFL